ncbi:MAG: hypothetical protein GY870_04180 [archaeon]|nr:hypothetical protein [archaeon]
MGKKDNNKRKSEEDKNKNPDLKKIMDKFLKNFTMDVNFTPFIDFESIDIFSPKPGMKSNSIQYKFGTGMDKPEIRINGKIVDDKQLNELFGNMNSINPNILGSNPRIPNTVDISEVSLLGDESSSEIEDEIEDVYFEIFEDTKEDLAEVTIEMPGVTFENININYSANGVIISGRVGERLFQKAIQLKFKPNKENSKIFGKNGIFQITFKK